MSLTCRRLSVDPSDGHLDITGQFLTDDDAVVQTLGCVLRFILGEWFLNTSEGIPWMAQPNATARPILGVLPADLAYGEGLIKAAILSVDGVASIDTFSFNFNHTTRAATCTAKGKLDSGGPYAISEALP